MIPVELAEIKTLTVSNYDQVRDELRTGDVLFCSGGSVASRIIRTITRSPYSHVGLVVRMLSIDRILLLESKWPHGVRAVALSSYLNNWKWSGKPYHGHLLVGRHARFNVKHEASVVQLLSELVDSMGQKYKIGRLIRIAVREVIALVGLRFGKLHFKKPACCSEYIYQVYTGLGLPFNLNKNGHVLPVDLACHAEMSLICRLR
jgi:hypothetical protein